jgi:hypothetical protein
MSKINVWEYVYKNTSNPIPYKVYRRKTLLDKVVLVPIADIVANVPFIDLERDETLLN